ncbi:sugar kinase [Microbacterium sp. CFBP9034]|uniref:sugar kinase n=1 Tax=Microbacterium sp. CFBP9034 TaxID=3096540 RepID=UPI002A6AAEA8|nr:sugar kinase [Microbacterium sp. CFBP9034]MDY0908209.1 sugar kinase [Microbacterium sp. CFBP9034]
MTGLFTLGEGLGLIRGDGIGGLERLATAHIDTGGAEGNVAIGVARLGGEATWLGRVGDDALGRRVAGDLRSESVTVHAVVDTEAPTGLMLKSTPRAGATVVDYYRRGSAGSRLSPADLEGSGLEDHRILHVTGITLALSSSARAAVLAAVQRAKSAGLLVSFAVNHRSRLWDADEATPHYLALLRTADIVFASAEEGDLLVAGAGSPGTDPEELVRELSRLGADETILTLGADGAAAVIDGALHRVAAVPVSVVDTVGAGDAFAAGYLAERLSGAPAAQRLRTAVTAGALACAHPGDWQGAPRRPDLAAFDGHDPVSR